MSVQRYGLMTGATLHEVAQVLAAGAAHGGRALDLATITKLTRVALLAPTLLVVGTVLRRRDAAGATGSAGAARRPPLLPGFLVGFLVLGALRSLGAVPSPLVPLVQTCSTALMTAAMAGIGLAVDLRVVRRIGAPAVVLAVTGFALTLTIATLGTLGLPG